MKYDFKCFYFGEIADVVNKYLELDLMPTTKAVLKKLLKEIKEMDKIQYQRIRKSLGLDLKEEKKEWSKKFKDVKNELSRTQYRIKKHKYSKIKRH